MTKDSQRIRIASALVFVGLGVEGFTLRWSHPTAFLSLQESAVCCSCSEDSPCAGLTRLPFLSLQESAVCCSCSGCWSFFLRCLVVQTGYHEA